MSATGLPTRSVVSANVTRRPVKMSWSRVSRSAPLLFCQHADAMTVDSEPVVLRRGRQQVAPVRPPTQSKWVTTKGKAASRPVTRPCAHKATRIASPTPEVMAPTTPVAGCSQSEKVALFVDPIVSGDEGIGGSAPATSGEFPCP